MSYLSTICIYMQEDLHHSLDIKLGCLHNSQLITTGRIKVILCMMARPSLDLYPMIMLPNVGGYTVGHPPSSQPGGGMQSAPNTQLVPPSTPGQPAPSPQAVHQSPGLPAGAAMPQPMPGSSTQGVLKMCSCME